MCSSQNKKYNSFFIYTFAICFGLFSGLSDYVFLHDIASTIAETFIKIFKCISLPIISLSIIVSLLHYTPKGPTQKYLQKAILYTITTTVIAASVACILYLIIHPSNVIGAVDVTDEVVANTPKLSYLSHITNLIPSSVLAPFIEHQVIGVLFISAVIGISIHYIQNTEARSVISNFFIGLHGIFLAITGWVTKIIPLALYGFITTTTIQLKGGVNAAGIGEYLLVVLLANLIQGVIILPAWLAVNGINPLSTLKAVFPALAVAFFSKSSTGTLPVTIARVEKNLGINTKISRLLLPLCTTINMNGCAAFIFTTVIYLMQNNGVQIDLDTMIIWILISTVAAIGNAGIPMGCFFLSTSLLVSMNVPIGLLGIILPFYAIIDMVETTLNVWSDICVTKMVDHKSK